MQKDRTGKWKMNDMKTKMTNIVWQKLDYTSVVKNVGGQTFNYKY